MGILSNIEPKEVFQYFEELSMVPRCTFHTKKISDFCVEFAKAHNLEYIQDEMNNVIIKKPGTAGYEDSDPVIIQGHLDMVATKTTDSDHDFENDPLDLFVDGDLIGAKNTTLGGDDGIAVAYAMAILASTDIPHPPIEAVFTVDEEIGMGGAHHLDTSVLKGKICLNIDSEIEGVMTVGCAGGYIYDTFIPIEWSEESGTKMTISLSNLQGGHSGAEIDKNRANANKLMGRFLYGLKKKAEYALISLTGGQKDNAITRECTAEFLTDSVAEVKAYAKELQEQLREEYTGSDENITFEITEKGTATAEVLHPTSQEKIVFYLQNVPFGIQKMSGTIKGLVETSSNIGILRLDRDELFASSSVRSSVDAACSALSDKIEYLTEFLGGDYEVQGAYPAWEYRKESPLRDKMVAVFEEMYGHKPEVVAIHAGLECGLFYKKMEGLDCVSLGPDMKDIHTSEEVLSIASTERVWNYLVQVLKNLKD